MNEGAFTWPDRLASPGPLIRRGVLSPDERMLVRPVGVRNCWPCCSTRVVVGR